MSSFEKKLGQWIVKSRWWLIIATIIVVFIAASGMQNLTLNMDNRVFFSKDNPQLMALETLENTYTKTYNVFFLIDSKDGSVFNSKTLSALEGLTEASWKMPYSSRVDSITNFQHTRVDEDDLIVADLVEDALTMSNEEIDEIKKITLSEPLLVHRLISPAGDVTAVNINILLPGKSQAEVPEVAAFARKLADDFRKNNPEVALYLSGGLMVDNAFGEVTADDMSFIIPLMFLTLVIIIGLSLRSVTGTFATVIIILISMFTALGITGWLGMALNSASAHAPTIILTLAVADSVHILSSMFHQMHLGKSRHEALVESLGENFNAIFLTSITTVIGFLSMNFSDAPPFRDLGNIVAMGVTAAFIFSVTFLPAIMAVLPVRVKVRTVGDCEPGCAVECDCPCSCNSLADFVIKNRKPLFWGIVVVVLIFAAGITRIELNDNFVRYFSKDYDVRVASDLVEAKLSGIDAIEYSIKSGEPGGINEPAYLAKIEEFANWYREQPKVVHVSVITDILKRLNKNMHGDDPSFNKIPVRRDLAAQYLLLYEMSLPFGLDLNNQINVDKSASRMTVILKDMTTKEILVIENSGQQWLKANAPEQMQTMGSGLSVIWSHLAKRNIKSMLVASIGALVLISFILIFALKSVKFGLISLLPNLSPALMAFGLWGLIVGRVGLGLSIIVSMTLGVVVDDTIHFLSNYLRARREDNMSPQEAVRNAFSTVGRAMWITTLALVAGFLILLFSGFRMNSEMGLMTAITITFALAMDFFLLPTLLIKLEEKQSPFPKKQYDTFTDSLSTHGGEG